MAVGNLVKQLQDIMRKDAGINGDAQRIEQMVWVIFLKVYDAMEEDWELDDDDYESIIPEQLRWRNWAHSKDENGKTIKSLTDQPLLNFIDQKLFPVLKGRDFGEKPKDKKEGENANKDEKPKEYIPGIKVTRETPPHQAIVYEVFKEANQYMKDGTLLRQLIDKIDEVDLLDSEESHAFGNMYESILKDLQGAGNAGEFYTPRAVTDFIIKMLDPKLGEVVGDFAMGTGGFLVSALNYMKPQIKQSQDMELWQNSIIGQEWKPFPYLLAVTNVLLHEIKDPQLFHMDSLSKSMSDYEEEGKVNVIAMNPPYGGATSASTKNNFKAEYRSSETADLFMVLIMQRLAEDGRAGVIVPDGFLFGTDGAKLAIKKRMYKEFNVHTIVRLPGSVFLPYTSIATNIIFFNNEKADDAPDGFNTAKTWFYRLDKPQGYINFSKTKPILPSHFNEVCNWWKNRKVMENGRKAQCFTLKEIELRSYNLDLCKYPKEEEVILRPNELMNSYLDRSNDCFKQITATLANLSNKLHGKDTTKDVEIRILNPWQELATITASLPEKLKKSILQDAIMGKLDTKNEEDESSCILLEHIRAEKKRLVREGVLKKKDLEETPIQDDEIPISIPENWSAVRLGEITYNHGQKTPTEDFSYIDIGSIDNKRQKLNDSENIIKAKDAPSRARKIVKWGDILYATVRPYLHNMCLVDRVFEKEPIASTGFAVMACVPGLFNKYLFYYLLSPIFDAYANDGDNAKGMAYPAINDKKLYNGVVPLPPLAEQHRIVDKIEKLFAEIDNMTINKDINETETEERDE